MTLSSLDTNILVYAADEDSLEHERSYALVERALDQPQKWMLSDQVLFEFYKALRNAKIFKNPLSAKDASSRILFLREESGFQHCCYRLDNWSGVYSDLSKRDFPQKRTHDCILAHTLIQNGVTTFYTRNTKDFASHDFNKLINPIDV